MTQPKDKIARLLADRMNYQPFSNCQSRGEKDEWYSEYGRVINILNELEDLARTNLVRFSGPRININEIRHMPQKQRSPKEINRLYKRLRREKNKKGIIYRKEDFARDLGYSRPGTVSDILSGRTKPLPQVEIILDYMEQDLN